MTSSASIAFETRQLSRALRDLRGAVMRRSSIPVLGCVLVEVGADGVATLSATDMDVMAQRRVQLVSASGPVRFAIDAHRLADVVNTFDGGSQCAIDISLGAAVVKSGRSRLRFSTMLPDTFPVLQQRQVAASFEIPASSLLDAASKVRHAIGDHPVRYYLNGYFAHVRDGRLRLVCCDGDRLARHIAALPEGAAEMPDSIIAKSAVDLVRQAAESHEGPLGMAFGDDKITFTAGEFTLVSKVVEGTYPQYDQIIPAAPPVSATVDRDDLVAALVRMAIATDGKTRVIRITVDGEWMTIAGQSADHGDAEEQLQLTAAHTGEALTINFNLKFLRDALGALDVDDVTIGMTNPSTAAVISSPSAPELALVVGSTRS